MGAEMKAAVVKEFGKDFVIEDVQVPTPKDNEALVSVKAACLCAADLKIRDGRFPHFKLPLVTGHEVSGQIASVGRNVRGVKPGDRVVVYPYTACGDCHACREGRDNLCVRLSRIGFERDGGHADFVSVPESQLTPLPDSISYEEGAAIPDAVCTVLHAIRDLAQVKLNDYVLLNGVGGLGMQAVQIARLSGARVIATARTEKKLDMAKSLGADWVLNGNDEHLVDKIMKLTGGLGVDVVIDLVVTQNTFQTSVDCLKKGGTIVIVGSTHPEIRFNVGQMIMKEIAVRGTLGMKKQTVIDAVDLCASGKVKAVVTERFPLEKINEAALMIKEGRHMGRVVMFP
jgi:2-desacetyl-2-hydroxyethyl bacteriochlorophyllide A dehydrogenase